MEATKTDSTTTGDSRDESSHFSHQDDAGPAVACHADRRVLLDHHRDHLRTSGLTDATIDSARIYSVTDPADAAAILNWSGPDGPAPAIAFPNFGVNGKVSTTILRPDEPRARRDGKAPKYEWPVGQAARLYYPPHVLVPRSRFQDPNVPLLLVEGIKKVLSIVQTGVELAPISAQGVTVWHDVALRKKTSLRRLHPDLDDIPIEGRIVYICFDGGDTSENPPVIDAEARLARALLDEGANVRLVRVPYRRR